MANLITAYYTKKNIPIHIEYVPGDIIVIAKLEHNIFVESHTYEELYIVNLNREPKLITKRCPLCEKFHISQVQYINYLGNHWEKYKNRFYDLGLPITNSSCNPYNY